MPARDARRWWPRWWPASSPGRWACRWGSLGFDPLAHEVAPELASRVLWFDALVRNVDRSWRNPNLLLWHGALHLIDHGASLIFHHDWSRAAAAAGRAYEAEGHVLAGMATAREAADVALAPQVTAELLDGVAALVPDAWLADEPGFDGPDDVRAAYRDHLLARVGDRTGWRP